MKQYQERNYAPKTRKVTKSDLQKYINRDESREVTETSGSNSVECSRQEQEEIKSIDLLPLPLCLHETHEGEVKWFNDIAGLTSYQGDKDGQSEVGLGSEIQSCGKTSCQVGSGKSSRGSSSSRDEEVRQSQNGKDGISRQEKERLNEESRKENVGKTHQQGRQGIQSSNQGRCEAEESNITTQTKREKMKKESVKEKKHEAKESKAYERKEHKKEEPKEKKSAGKKK